MIQDFSIAEYRCPGETYGISRAVHLGRLASFHPACRDCPRCDDAVGLSARQISQLAEVGSRARQPQLFHAEGVGHVAINDLGPHVARRIAVEFARRIEGPAATKRNRQPTVVVASDGRLATAAIVAAIVEGVRWTGCETIDIGPASAPCTASAIEHLAADGAVFVGNAHGAPHTVGLKFWAHGEPLSQGGLLDEIAASLPKNSGAAMIDRPTRAFGTLRRFAAADVYLNELRAAYHALRPLRFVLDCTAGPVVAYLKELTRNVACQIISPVGNALRGVPYGIGSSPSWNTTEDRNATEGVPYSRDTHSKDVQSGLGEQVLAAQAHFGMQIGDDGENCRVVDQCGRSVKTEELSALIAGSFAGPVMQGEELRQQTFLRMRESRATIAADPAGRLWYAAGHAPLPDALRTLTLLLVLLSRNDLAFSAVLDQETPAV